MYRVKSLAKIDERNYRRQVVSFDTLYYAPQGEYLGNCSALGAKPILIVTQPDIDNTPDAIENKPVVYLRYEI